VHLYAGRHYGYFVDELYYLACSRHLDWGYVDHPPLIAWITWTARSVFGDSLAAIRFLPAVAAAGEVVLTALITCELGGKRFAQGLRRPCHTGRAGYPRYRQLAIHECIRAAVLDGLRLAGHTYRENRQPKALDLVRDSGRIRPRKQVLHADLRSRALSSACS
jgi:Dolichyl-phosphate-mannose-protein mannosyltransferase